MISAIEVRALFKYFPSTGRFVRLGAKGKVGSLHSSGYIHMRAKGRIYKAHRLAWLYMTGEWPKEDVEHKNRKKADNRWLNLREANDSQNQANVTLRVDNTSGYKGVCYRSKNGKWRARLQVRNKRICLGDFNCPKKAARVYMIAAKQHFGEFARAG